MRTINYGQLINGEITIQNCAAGLQALVEQTLALADGVSLPNVSVQLEEEKLSNDGKLLTWHQVYIDVVDRSPQSEVKIEVSENGTAFYCDIWMTRPGDKDAHVISLSVSKTEAMQKVIAMTQSVLFQSALQHAPLFAKADKQKVLSEQLVLAKQDAILKKYMLCGQPLSVIKPEQFAKAEAVYLEEEYDRLTGAVAMSNDLNLFSLHLTEYVNYLKPLHDCAQITCYKEKLASAITELTELLEQVQGLQMGMAMMTMQDPEVAEQSPDLSRQGVAEIYTQFKENCLVEWDKLSDESAGLLSQVGQYISEADLDAQEGDAPESHSIMQAPEGHVLDGSQWQPGTSLFAIIEKYTASKSEAHGVKRFQAFDTFLRNLQAKQDRNERENLVFIYLSAATFRANVATLVGKIRAEKKPQAVSAKAEREAWSADLTTLQRNDVLDTVTNSLKSSKEQLASVTDESIAEIDARGGWSTLAEDYIIKAGSREPAIRNLYVAGMASLEKLRSALQQQIGDSLKLETVFNDLQSYRHYQLSYDITKRLDIINQALSLVTDVRTDLIDGRGVPALELLQLELKSEQERLTALSNLSASQLQGMPVSTLDAYVPKQDKIIYNPLMIVADLFLSIVLEMRRYCHESQTKASLDACRELVFAHLAAYEFKALVANAAFSQVFVRLQKLSLLMLNLLNAKILTGVANKKSYHFVSPLHFHSTLTRDQVRIIGGSYDQSDKRYKILHKTFGYALKAFYGFMDMGFQPEPKVMLALSQKVLYELHKDLKEHLPKPSNTRKKFKDQVRDVEDGLDDLIEHNASETDAFARYYISQMMKVFDECVRWLPDTPANYLEEMHSAAIKGTLMYKESTRAQKSVQPPVHQTNEVLPVNIEADGLGFAEDSLFVGHVATPMAKSSTDTTAWQLFEREQAGTRVEKYATPELPHLG